MTTKNFTQAQLSFQARVIELIEQGRSPRGAHKQAKRERKAAHPQHIAAAARRWASAQDRRAAFEAKQ